jgi:hypothetical protein
LVGEHFRCTSSWHHPTIADFEAEYGPIQPPDGEG